MLSGLIIIWHSTIATIPAGWHLCDGAEGTPDYRNRYPIPAGQDIAGDPTAMIAGVQQHTGGVATHVHALESGDAITNSAPAGTKNNQAAFQWCYPPSKAFPYIMKL